MEGQHRRGSDRPGGDASRDRGGVAHRIGKAHRRPARGSYATWAWPRTSRRTRLSPRWSSGLNQVFRTIRAPGSWPLPAIGRSIRSAAANGTSRSTSNSVTRSTHGRSPPSSDLVATLDDDVGDDLLRLDVHGVPPGALDRSPRRADTAAAGRAHHRGDRARVSRPGRDRRPADRPRQTHPHRGQGPVRGSTRGRSRRTTVVGAGGSLPDLQRGLLGDRRR